jgi:hypothetical protein
MSSARRRRNRKLERQALDAIDELDAHLAGEDRACVVAAALLVDILNRRSVYRDVRAELHAAASALRHPGPFG